ncbi:MAG: alpha-D-ribose 1-methylphosphonate 5-triphosphate diphosphatase [Acetobacterales bacterium]
MRLSIEGGTALTEDRLGETAVLLDDDRIDTVGRESAGNARRFDARGLLVLPGLVDIHGDSFERQIQPRPGIGFPMDIALLDTDRQMTAAGFTTAFHAVTLSWEPGLPSIGTARSVIDTVEALRPRLSCDTRLHIRWETYALDHVDELDGWLADRRVDLLAINDHFPEMMAKADRPDSLGKHAGRAGQSTAEYRADLDKLAGRETEVAPAKARLIARARAASLAVASHDEKDPALRQAHHAMGCHICEFPMNRETAAASVVLGDPVVMGAPNVVRGGSHNKMIEAAPLVCEGLCTVLASDYYYPTLAVAPFVLAQRYGMALEAAWRVCSTNPARAAGFEDRGELAPGQRADIVLVDATRPDAPRVVATFVGGRPAFQTPDAFARFH